MHSPDGFGDALAAANPGSTLMTKAKAIISIQKTMADEIITAKELQDACALFVQNTQSNETSQSSSFQPQLYRRRKIWRTMGT